eukprot:scaffold49620_cov41-Tisochrysis_lutea.AAC.1
MREATTIALGVAAAAAVGTAYVLVHERRRKHKAERRAAAAADAADGSALTKAKLIAILHQSSTAAYQLIDQTRKMVYAKHEQTGIPLDKCVEELQQNFEHAMETVVFQIRKNHGVTEQQMTAAMVANQNDEEVQQALATLRDAMSGKPPPSPPKSDSDDTTARLKARRAKARKK